MARCFHLEKDQPSALESLAQGKKYLGARIADELLLNRALYIAENSEDLFDVPCCSSSRPTRKGGWST